MEVRKVERYVAQVWTLDAGKVELQLISVLTNLAPHAIDVLSFHLRNESPNRVRLKFERNSS